MGYGNLNLILITISIKLLQPKEQTAAQIPIGDEELKFGLRVLEKEIPEAILKHFYDHLESDLFHLYVYEVLFRT